MPQEAKKYKILLVDDDADVLTSAKIALEPLGHTLLTASDGLAALERADAEDPDIVVLDLMLPKRGGLQILQRLKGHPSMKGKRPLVCMITGTEGGTRSSPSRTAWTTTCANRSPCRTLWTSSRPLSRSSMRAFRTPRPSREAGPMHGPMNRRDFLRTAGVAGAALCGAALGGCSSGGASGSADGGDLK
jgi:CheY-like chemotaxis protein